MVSNFHAQGIGTGEQSQEAIFLTELNRKQKSFQLSVATSALVGYSSITD